MMGRERNLEERRETMIKVVPYSPAYELSNIRCRLASSQRLPLKKLEPKEETKPSERITEKEQRQLKNNRTSMITPIETSPSHEMSNIRCRLASSESPVVRLLRKIEQRRVG